MFLLEQYTYQHKMPDLDEVHILHYKSIQIHHTYYYIDVHSHVSQSNIHPNLKRTHTYIHISLYIIPESHISPINAGGQLQILVSTQGALFLHGGSQETGKTHQ